jgi:hypothetical protein
MFGKVKDRVYHKYEKESSKFRKIEGKGWTINLDDLSLEDFDIIVYETRKYLYRIKTEEARFFGYIRILGGEKKLIVPLKRWEKIEKTGDM